jgi:hypothetical protein
MKPAAMSTAILIGEALLGYVAADALTGIYHAATDYGWNVRSQVDLFQDHHDHPRGITRDPKPAFAGVPLMLCAALGHPAFFLVLGAAISLCQVSHYYAHHRGGAVVCFLQRWHVILPPREHAVHHRDHDLNFCIVSGWNNRWLNWVLKFPMASCIGIRRPG